MKQFAMRLRSDNIRPIVHLKNWDNLFALLDTGAKFPVWTSYEDNLKALGAECIKENVSFGGFSGAAVGNLYKLKMLIVGELIFNDIPIIACQDMGDVPFQLILSASMFFN